MKSGNNDTIVIQNSECLAFKIENFRKKQARNSYIVQTLPNEIRFEIKLKPSEWKSRPEIPSNFPQRNSI